MGLFGNISLVIAFAAGLFCLAALKLFKNKAFGLRAGILSGIFIIISAAVLFFLLIAGDFSVAYVFRNTDRALPLLFKISAFWSGSAGSLLLWALCNTGTYLIIYRANKGNKGFQSCLTAVMTVFNLGFLAVLIFVNSPFQQTAPNSDGFGLNPSLQSVGMVYHPPLVMISYALIFAAFAAKLYEILHPDGARIRTAGNAALLGWIVLTAGIVSGGLWAYSELGWGGYWAWDPIENSALATWLLVTAYIHLFSLRHKNTITDRPLFAVLAAAAFSILFGTFLARSGVLKSVHSYSNHASRVFFVALLALLAAVSIGIFIAAFKKKKKTGAPEAQTKRLYALMPALLLILSAVMIGLMTIMPLLPPGGLVMTEKTFDIAFGTAGLGVLLLSTAFYALKGRSRRSKLLTALIALILGTAVPFLPAFSLYPLFTRVALGISVLSLAAMILGLVLSLEKILNSGRRFALFLVHLSLCILAFGFIGTRGMKTETSCVVQSNDTVGIGCYTVTLRALAVDDGAFLKNWTAGLGYSDGGAEKGIEASLRYYKQKDIYHSKARIVSSFGEDLYILVENAADDGTVLLKLSVLKWVSFLWIGFIMMVSASVYLQRKGLCGNT
jgi:cytochrome c-type biogenesis protein CcmF